MCFWSAFTSMEFIADLADLSDDGNMIVYDGTAPKIKPLVMPMQTITDAADVFDDGNILVHAPKMKPLVMQPATRSLSSLRALKKALFHTTFILSACIAKTLLASIYNNADYHEGVSRLW